MPQKNKKIDWFRRTVLTILGLFFIPFGIAFLFVPNWAARGIGTVSLLGAYSLLRSAWFGSNAEVKDWLDHDLP